MSLNILFIVDRVMHVAEGDCDLVSDLLRSYIHELPQRMDSLRVALDNRDIQRIERIVHTVKGSSAIVGAEALHRVAFDLEKATKNKDWDTIQNIGLTFISVADETLQVIKKFYYNENF